MIWNIEEGLKLTVGQLERAEAQRVAMTARTLEFFRTYDLLLTPATIVAPFPIENRYVAECAGRKFDNYVEWLGIVYAITLVCCPALSLPCGFTASGLPVGLQMVGPPRGEGQLLAYAMALEDILGVRGTTPIDPRGRPEVGFKWPQNVGDLCAGDCTPHRYNWPEHRGASHGRDGGTLKWPES